MLHLRPLTRLSHQGLALAGALVVLYSTVAPAALAEVLVLKDGQQIETQGPWTVDGRRVTYTALNGTFSALRLSLIDLEKSRELSDARLQPAAAPAEPEPPREAGLVVRQGDLRTAAPPLEVDDSETPAAPDGELAVVQWREQLEEQGTKLLGDLRNGTEFVYIGLDLEVTLIAENGDRLATRSAKLDRTWADPGTGMSFEVSFPDTFAYTDVAFEIKGQPYERQVPTPDPEEADSINDESTTDPPPR